VKSINVKKFANKVLLPVGYNTKNFFATNYDENFVISPDKVSKPLSVNILINSK